MEFELGVISQYALYQSFRLLWCNVVGDVFLAHFGALTYYQLKPQPTCLLLLTMSIPL